MSLALEVSAKNGLVPMTGNDWPVRSLVRLRRFIVALAGVGIAAMLSAACVAQTAVGTTSETKTATVVIATPGTVSSIHVLTQGAEDKDFKKADSGGTCAGFVGMSVAANATCTVEYTFTPSRPGQRLGGVTLMSTSGPLGQAPLVDVGAGPLLEFPGTTAVLTLGSGFGSPFSGPFGIAVDGNGNVFVSDQSNGAVYEMFADNNGVVSSSSTMVQVGGSFNAPAGVAVDGNGNIFVAEANKQSIKEILAGTGGNPAGVVSSTSTVVAVGNGFSRPYSVALDQSGNVFVADLDKTAVYEILAGTGGNPTGVVSSSSTVVPVGSGFLGPLGVAVDQSGNVFVADVTSNAVYEILAGTGNNPRGVVSSSSTVVPVGSGFFSPFSVAVDQSGNVFVADNRSPSLKEIQAGTNGNAAGVVSSSSTVVPIISGSSNDGSVALDGKGHVFFANLFNSVVSVIDLTAPSALTFGSTAVGTISSDSPQRVTAQNAGYGTGSSGSAISGDLNFSAVGLGADPNFTLGTGTCTTSSPLAWGTNCTVSANFAPLMSGALASSITLTDDTLHVAATSQTIPLAGTATQATGATAQTIAFPQPATPVQANTSVTLTATSDSGLPVAYSVVSGSATVSGSTVTYTGGGTVVLEADQYGNNTYAPALPVQRTVSVTPAADTVGTISSKRTATVVITTAGTIASINVLTQGAANKDFIEASPDGGTCAKLLGTSVAVNTTCTVEYTFTPSRPGQRPGAIVLMGSSGPLGQTLIVGTGTGPLVEFPGSTAVSTVADGIQLPEAAAVDGNGNVFFTEYGADAAYLKEAVADSAGGVSVVTVSGFLAPIGVAVDGSGNVFVALLGAGNGAVKEILAGTGGNGPGMVSSSSTIVAVGSGFIAPSGVTVDTSGNVFVADRGDGAVGNGTVKEIVAGTNGNPAGIVSSSSTVVTVATGFSKPNGVAVDSRGNVFVADFGNNAVKEILADSTGVVSSSSTVRPIASISSANSVAVDGAGNVFVASYSGNMAWEILAGTGGDDPGIVSPSSTVVPLGSDFSHPTDLVPDGRGHVFVTDAGHGQVRVIDLTAPPALAFASTTVGGSSGPQGVTVQNAGNAALSISTPSSGSTNPNVSQHFGLDASSNCPIVASGSAGTLAPNGLCTYAFNFVPQSAGTISSGAALTDDSVGFSGSIQKFGFSGIGTVGTPVVTPTATAVTVGMTSTTLSATISFGGEAPTGAVTFLVDSEPAVLRGCTVTTSPMSCTASYATGSLTVGTQHTVTASIAADANYNGASGTSLLTVIPANSTAPTTAVATTSPIQTAMVLITTAGTVSSINVLTQGAADKDFKAGNPIGGTCAALVGQSVTANTTCTVEYTFTPSRPGQRQGAIVLMGSSGPIGQALLVGTGTGPLVEFPGSTAVSIIGGLRGPWNAAEDGNGNLFVIENSAGTLKEILADSTGVVSSSSKVVTVRTDLSAPYGVAVDGSGNVFVADHGSHAVKEIIAGTGDQPAGVVSSSSAMVTVGNGINAPVSVAVDASGNVFVGDNSGVVNEILAGTGGNPAGVVSSSSTVVTVASNFLNPYGVAVDSRGNVFVADFVKGVVAKIVPGTGAQTIAQLSGAYGVAVDGGGNVFVASYSDGSVKEILAGTGGNPAGVVSSSSNIVTVGSDFGNPTGVAVDGLGHVFVTNAGGTTVRRIDLTAPPAIAFASAAVGSTSSAPQSITVQNAGNDSLSFSAIALDDTTNFSIDSTTTCSTSAVLAQSGLCAVAANFKPASGGPLSTMLNLTDNNLMVPASVQAISLSGSGTQAIATISVPQANITYGDSPTVLTATVSGTGIAPAGTVSFSIDGGATVPATSCTTSAASKTCTVSYITSTLAVAGNPHSIKVSLNGDPYYADVSGAGYLAVSKATPTITTVPTASSIKFGQTLASSALSGGVASTAGTFVWTDPSTVPSVGTSSYSVTFTPTDNANYNSATTTISLSVGKATPTITTPPTASTITYGQQLASSKLTGGTASTGGIFTWTNPTTSPSAGTASYSVTFTPTDSTDYETATTNVSVTVSKATPTITTPPTASPITYGAQLGASKLTGGVASTPGSFYWTNDTAVPTAGTAGHWVTFTPTDTANYDNKDFEVMVTVNKATPAIKVLPTASSITYGQTLASSTLSGGTASTGGTFAWTNPTTAPSAGTASYSVTFTPTDATDYDTVTTNVSVTTAKATPTITTLPTASSITYGQTLSSSSLSGGVASTTGAFAWTNPTTAPSAGTASYSVTFTPTDTTDYDTVTTNVSVTTAKAKPTITTSPTASSITYGQTLSSSSLSGGVASTSGTFAWTTPTTAPHAGTASYSVTFTPTDLTDYETLTTSVSVTTAKAKSTITTPPTASSITYGQTLSVSLLTGGVASTTGTFAWTAPTTTPSAGTVSYSVTFTPTDTADYETATVTVSMTVNKATPSITTPPTASSITYGQTLSSSKLSGGTASTTGAFTWTNPGVTPLVGMASYSVTFTPTDVANYNPTALAVSVTVSKATPTITTPPAASSITYGQTLSSSTLSGGAASTPGSFAWINPSTAPSAGTGSYSVTFTPSDTANYDTTTLMVSVIVSKATPSITTPPAASPITYGQILSSSALSGGVASTPGMFAWSNPSIAPSAGTASYPVTFTPTDIANYNTATITISVTVDKATPTISISVANHRYGDAPFAVSASSSSTGAFSYAVITGPAIATGNTVTLTGAGSVTLQASQAADSNYAAKTQTVSFTVSPAMTSVMVSNSSIHYGTATVGLTANIAYGPATAPAGAVTFVVDNGSPASAVCTGTTSPLTCTASYPTGSLAIGTHSITVSEAADANYLAASATAALTVTSPLDFVFTPSSTTSQTVMPGSAATYTFQVSPQNGLYPDSVSFTATGLPPGSTYTLTPTTIAQNGGAQTVTLTVKTRSPLMANRKAPSPWPATVMAGLLLPFCFRRKMRGVLRAGLTVILLMVGAAAIGSLTGCGSGNGFLNEPSEGYKIVVTATSGTVQHTETVVLNVQ